MYCYRALDADPLKTERKEQAVIDETWERFNEWRIVTENTTLCRLLKAEGETITVATDVTYKDVVGRRWQRQVKTTEIPFQVITTLAIVKTIEGNLVLLPRDSGDWDYSLECPGGFIRSSHLVEGKISVSDFIRDRVIRDIHLKPEQVASCKYLTTYDAKDILEHMLVYEINLTLNQTELEEINPYLTVLPPDYKPANHQAFTNIPLHLPSKGALLTIETESAK